MQRKLRRERLGGLQRPLTQAPRSLEFMSLMSQRMAVCTQGQLVVHLSLHCQAPACLSFLPMVAWMLMETQAEPHSVGCDLCERLWVFLNVVFI